MSLVPVKFPFDPTGAAASNHVTDELHQLGNTNIRLFVPRYGAFFSDSVVLRDAATNRALVRNVDYYPSILYKLPTEQTGREIHQIIVIIDKTCGSDVLFDAQMVGGEYSYSYDAIIQLVQRVGLDGRPIEFDNIIGKPDGYDPAPHLHDVGDVYGFEFWVAAIDRLRDAVLLGSAAGQKGIYDYINAKLGEMQQTISLLKAARNTAKAVTDALGYTPVNKDDAVVDGPMTNKGLVYQTANVRQKVKPVTATAVLTNLDLATSNRFVVNLNTDTTLKFDSSKLTGFTSADSLEFSVLVKNDATAGRKLLFPANVMWPGKVEPARSTLAAALNEYTFTTYDGGLTWCAKLEGANFGVPG